MTATTPPSSRTITTPATLARWALFGFGLANLALLEVLFINYGTGKNAILTVAKFFGLHASLIMMCQILLVARLPWLDRRIGMDRLTAWHRWVGFTLLWTVLVHATLIVTGYAVLYDMTWFASFLSLAGVVASLLGMIAAATIIVIAVVSVRYVRRRLEYETWHAVHMLVYLAIGVGVAHQLLEGTTFPTAPAAAAYWWTLWELVIIALIGGRVVLPLWRNAYHQFRVAAVVPESDNVVSITLTGRHMDRWPAMAGQFCIWRFLGHNHWWKANPFSLSQAPDGRTLRLTAKNAGTTTAGLRDVQVGTRVFVEGPYGAFTSLHRTREATLLVAGGVGVTPIRAMLEEATGPTVVLYRARTPADAVLLSELQELAQARGAELHVLTGRTGPGNAPLEPEGLLAMVPDVVEREVFVCGPPAMTNAVLRSLRTLKVPGRQVHSERFSLA